MIKIFASKVVDFSSLRASLRVIFESAMPLLKRIELGWRERK